MTPPETTAQIQLTAIVLQDQLSRLISGCSNSNPLQVYEFQQDFPKDTYDWLIATQLLPMTLSEGPISFPGRGVAPVQFAHSVDEIAQMPLSAEDYHIAMANLFRDRLFWRSGLKFHASDMTPSAEAEPLFDLLRTCGWLTQEGDVWRWSAAAKPHLGPIPAHKPASQPPKFIALYQSMPLVLRLYFLALARLGSSQAVARAIRRHRRARAWHIKGNGFYELDDDDISPLTLAQLIVHLGAKPNTRSARKAR